MKKLTKRFAAMGTAAMMIASMSTVCASADYEVKNLEPITSFSNESIIAPYISTDFNFYAYKDSSFTRITSTDWGRTVSSGRVFVNICIGQLSQDCYITFEVRVNGVKRGSGTVRKTGNNPFTFYDSHIPYNGNITISATFHYSKYNSTASGYFVN